MGIWNEKRNIIVSFLFKTVDFFFLIAGDLNPNLNPSSSHKREQAISLSYKSTTNL